MKYHFVAILCLICHFSVQGTSLTGFVVDSKTNEPIFGVTLICQGAALAFSDDEGRFTLPVDNLQPEDIVLFRHISFQEQTVALSRLRLDSVVRMENRFISLSEVTVTPDNRQKLLKSIVAKYKKSAPAQPYWAKIHQAHSLTFRGKPAGYVEYTGYMLCMGSEVNDPFYENHWIPEYVRRTTEDPTIALIFGGQDRVRFSEASISSLWTGYRFFDVTHPLSKRNNAYAVSVDSVITVNGKDFFVLSYQQTGRINVVGLSIKNNSGQMWIEKNTNQLAHLTGNCNVGDLFVIQLDIAYGTSDNYVIPRDMHISVIQNKTLRGNRTQEKLMCESRISFSEADSRKQKKFKREYVGFFEEFLVTELPYNAYYWSRFPIAGNIDFQAGAKLPIWRNENDPDIQALRLDAQTMLQQMKNEIQSSTWKTIQPIK